MGCGASAPAVLVPQPYTAEPILPMSLPYLGGALALRICDESWWSDPDRRKAKQESIKEAQTIIKLKGADSIVKYKSATGEIILSESRNFWANDTNWSTVKFHRPLGGGAANELVAVLSEGANESSGTTKAFAYQQSKGKALLCVPVDKKSQSLGVGDYAKTEGGVPMHILRRCAFFGACAFHPAAGGGKFLPALLKVNAKGTVTNASGEVVAMVEDPNSNGLWTWVLHARDGAPLQVAANVDVMVVVAVVSQFAANRKARLWQPSIVSRGTPEQERFVQIV